MSQVVTGFQAFCRGFLTRRRMHRRFEKLAACRVIQKNARIYVTLRNWAWWKLYSKVKPLLNASQIDQELRKREELIQSLELQVRQETEERVRLDQLNHRLEDDKRCVEEILVNEKNAAADQEEILRRTQKRELALEEELQALSVEWDTLETTHQETLRQKLVLDSEAKQLQLSIETLSRDSERLERERFAKENRCQLLEDELAQLQSALDSATQERRIHDVQRLENLQKLEEASANNQQLIRQRDTFQSQSSDLESQLEQLQKQYDDLKRQFNVISSELAQCRESLAESTRSTILLEASLTKAQRDLTAATDRAAMEVSSREALEQQKRDMTTKLEHLGNELEMEKSLTSRITRQKTKMEQELTDLHQLVDAKGDEQSKMAESRRLRESEFESLRASFNAVQVFLLNAELD